jgi:hypothetical protein
MHANEGNTFQRSKKHRCDLFRMHAAYYRIYAKKVDVVFAFIRKFTNFLEKHACFNTGLFSMYAEYLESRVHAKFQVACMRNFKHLPFSMMIALITTIYTTTA